MTFSLDTEGGIGITKAGRTFRHGEWHKRRHEVGREGQSDCTASQSPTWPGVCAKGQRPAATAGPGALPAPAWGEKEPGALGFLASATSGGSCHGAAASRFEGLGLGVRPRVCSAPTQPPNCCEASASQDPFLIPSLLSCEMGKSVIRVSAWVILQTQGG